jgi:hypothetical protein
MEILGHSQISLTMNTYSHGRPRLKREAASQMGKVLTGGLSSSSGVISPLSNRRDGTSHNSKTDAEETDF